MGRGNRVGSPGRPPVASPDVDAELARRRVTGAPVGHLATVTSEGRAHVVPCCFALEGDRIYTAVDAKAKSTLALRRLDNVRAHPGVSLLVDHYEDDWSALWWVRIDGTARGLRVGPAACPGTGRPGRQVPAVPGGDPAGCGHRAGDRPVAVVALTVTHPRNYQSAQPVGVTDPVIERGSTGRRVLPAS